jgi:hypothetical protein
MALHKKCKYTSQSANGAEYESQGQARSASPLGTLIEEARNMSAFQASAFYGALIQGRRVQLASHLPLASIYRAVGAQKESTPVNQKDLEGRNKDHGRY